MPRTARWLIACCGAALSTMGGAPKPGSASNYSVDLRDGTAARTTATPATRRVATEARVQPLEAGSVRLESDRPPSPFAFLPPLRIQHLGTQAWESVRLYDDLGRVDESAAQRLDRLLCDARDPDNVHTTVIDRRTLKLLFRAAYHFQAERVEVVSAYRQRGRRREGFHALGRAIDFKLKGVPAARLASYLRGLPRVGVGIYTHPKTQFVHLDSREQSFHWLDASPPGRSWRERALKSASSRVRDAAYRPEDDWPEAVSASGYDPDASRQRR